MKSEKHWRPKGSSWKTGRTEPPAGSGEPGELIFGLHAVREALRSGSRPVRRLVVVRTDRQFGDLVQLAREAGVPVRIEPRQALDRLVPSGHHQGIIALVGAKAYVEPDDMLRTARERGEPALVLLLDGVEDPHNLGAVLRTAEAAGAHGVVIPERRSVGLTATVAKASAGAVEHLPVACVPNLSRAIEQLQAQGLWVYALDPSAQKSYTALDVKGPVALVLGGEGKGVRAGVLDKCDDRARIPMSGRV
ncbi:MAG: 23S rRNA (guanosine(2251)-2'-O)-methyltransferase RlmB, partial [Burkholderiales bacterium]